MPCITVLHEVPHSHNFQVLHESAADSAKEHAGAIDASKTQSRSLADKLAAAQRAALEINEQRQIANLALQVHVSHRKDLAHVMTAT